MNEHITPKRLYELAQMRFIVDQPEWEEHIRDCPDCGLRYIQFLKNKVEAARKKGDKPASGKSSG
jgi:hypothetical protein